MTDITIIGTGNMAGGLATRAIAAGKSVQLLAHEDKAKAQALAAELGGQVSTGVVGDELTSNLVIPAVYFDAAKAIVARYGDALNGKVYVDITNPVDFATFEGLAVPADSSAAEELQKITGANVVKAFNTTFAATLGEGAVAGHVLDVLVAGDDEVATQAVVDFAAAAGLNPVVVGPQRRARQLEQTGFLHILLSANDQLPAYQWNSGVKLVPAT
ncbi:NADPH-dependent F420 reductase [Paenarthrobacter ureafaciens]|uniref:NADPH-dependent F420 reductase n=1 Tax=Paenarthrobacter TaxID=1742992 RepID=UPI0014074E1A|nr:MULTISPECIES: NAD(P)-binding domain-containing protein [Paenarthrobacter]MCW3768425.1 NAD(P)-binding domain-containing protein [Paenarthrobacter sp. PAE-2]MCX8456604.1 NAD(P)-binding domain-containing protein [Paenarthrobacter ureafaciens]MCY0974818.1 NAD(P)-binding domain-containing protein [Paenarthrobacter ureafaciens]